MQEEVQVSIHKIKALDGKFKQNMENKTSDATTPYTGAETKAVIISRSIT